MIGHDTPVFISAPFQNKRYWLRGASNEMNKALGRLILQGSWSDDPGLAVSVKLELALVYRRRFKEECNQPVDLSLAAGSLEFVEPENTSGLSGPDERGVMQYRGILCRPGVDVKSGTKTWFVKMKDPQRGELESIRGDSPEDAVSKVFERGLESLAEKAPAPVAPQPATQVPPARSTRRIRPGSLR